MRRLARLALTGAGTHAASKSDCDDALPARHDSLREGAMLGLVVATGTWAWLAVVDAIAGQPFHAFTVLGGIAVFTVMHYLLNIVYGVVIVSGVHGAARTPSLTIALVFFFVMTEIAFAMITVLLSNLGLGELAWIGIFGGSLVGAAIAMIMLLRRYPLAELLHAAEEER